MEGINYNESNFKDALLLVDESILAMDDVSSSVAGVIAPGDYSNSSSVERILTEITLNLRGSMDNFKTPLISMVEAIEKNNDDTKNKVNDLNGSDFDSLEAKYGDVLGFREKAPVIDLSLFKAIESENGTYYKCYSDVVDAGILSNRCDIYVPKNTKLIAATIYFSGLGSSNGNLFDDVFIRESIAKGKIKTNGIIIIPDDCYTGKMTDGSRTYADLNEDQAKKIADSAKIIAKGFGISDKNINVYAFSAGGAIATSLISKNEAGTFNTLIMGSNCENLDSVTDPNLRIISLVGANESTKQPTDNASNVINTFADYKETHINDVEQYVVQPTPNVEIVDHGHVSEAAFTNEIFDGKNILDYAATPRPDASSVPSTPTPTVTAATIPTPAPLPKPTPSAPIPSVPSTPKMSESRSYFSEGEIESFDVTGNAGQGGKYSMSNTNGSDYQQYLKGMSEKGYKLSSDGTYWANGNNKIYVDSFNSSNDMF